VVRINSKFQKKLVTEHIMRECERKVKGRDSKLL